MNVEIKRYLNVYGEEDKGYYNSEITITGVSKSESLNIYLERYINNDRVARYTINTFIYGIENGSKTMKLNISADKIELIDDIEFNEQRILKMVNKANNFIKDEE